MCVGHQYHMIITNAIYNLLIIQINIVRVMWFIGDAIGDATAARSHCCLQTFVVCIVWECVLESHRFWGNTSNSTSITWHHLRNSKRAWCQSLCTHIALIHSSAHSLDRRLANWANNRIQSIRFVCVFSLFFLSYSLF